MTKPIIVVKTCFKLLYAIQVVKKIFEVQLTSWPQLISTFLVAHTYLQCCFRDWPRTFFTPRVFLFSIVHTRMLVKYLMYKNKKIS